MSAFVVDKAHINALLQYGLSFRYGGNGNVTWYVEAEQPTDRYRKLTSDNVDQIGQMLLDECIESVQYRYEDSPRTDLPGRTDGEYLLPFQHKPLSRTPSPVEVLKLIACYEYQSCEHPGWHTSEAKVFCDALRHFAINGLPGYEEAPWELSAALT